MKALQNSSKRIIIIIQLILFIGIAIFRLVNLRADSPFDISIGQELSTDSPQYTSFARNKVLFGEWEIFHTRYILFVKNITTLISYLMFVIFGTGRAQANLVAAVLNIITIFLCFLIWKKKDDRIAIASIAIIGFNYIFLIFGKLTFLEVTTVGIITLGTYFILIDKSTVLSAVIAGIFFSGAAFFSKLLAIIFFPLAVSILSLELYQNGESGILKKFNPLYAFLVGYISVFLVWILLVYFPSKGDISGYVTEFSIGMYGMPKALNSLKTLLVQLYSYGFEIKLWAKQPITFAAGFMGAAVLSGRILSSKKDMLKKLNRIDLYFLLWFLIVFITLFPWNYRPLRYAVLIIPPLSYLAARWILMIVDPPSEGETHNLFYYICIFIAGSFVSFHYLITPYFDERNLNLVLKYIPIGIVCGLTISFMSFLFCKIHFKRYLWNRKIWFRGRMLVVLIIIGIVTIQLSNILKNSNKNQETLYNASVDLGKILSPDAVVIGPYSSALTQDNHLRSVIKMFGVPVVERDFFKIVPATHIAVEVGGGPSSNEGRAFNDYPNIMNKAPIVATYYLRGYSVAIYLISKNSSNPKAQAYKPSLYERAAIDFVSNRNDSALTCLKEFEQQVPNTLSAKILRMKIFLAQNRLGDARTQLEEIALIDNGNLNIWLMLGELYLKSNPPELDMAYASFKKALYLRPNDKLISRQVKLLENYLK